MPAKKEPAKRISVSLPPSQIDWLKERPAGISGTLKGLLIEAMAMDNLRKSVRRLENRSVRKVKKK